jgi:hypothetical protein
MIRDLTGELATLRNRLSESEGVNDEITAELSAMHEEHAEVSCLLSRASSSPKAYHVVQIGESLRRAEAEAEDAKSRLRSQTETYLQVQHRTRPKPLRHPRTVSDRSWISTNRW